MADFTIAANLVLKQEGGLHNDSADPGGVTNFGIAQGYHPQLDITKLTRDQAVAIYRQEYWTGDAFADQRLANLVLSLSVNIGKGTTLGLLHRATGTLPSWPWEATIGLANRTPECLTEMATIAILYYSTKPEANVYLKGWVRRVVECLI